MGREPIGCWLAYLIVTLQVIVIFFLQNPDSFLLFFSNFWRHKCLCSGLFLAIEQSLLVALRGQCSVMDNRSAHAI